MSITDKFLDIMRLNMDEDEYARLMSGHRQSCPYYKRGDEYFIVGKQM